MSTNYRFDPYNDALEPLTVTDEIYRIPLTTPYTLKLDEVPYETSPSTMSMRLCDTTTAAITSTTTTTITVSNGAWFAAGNTITIDAEEMYISLVSSNTLTVTRGYNSTTANTHSLGADVFIESSMTEVSSTPASGQYYPDYACEVTDDSSWNTGTILFNSADAGKRIAVSYQGLGSLADDRLTDFTISPNLRVFGDESDGDFTSSASFTATTATYNCRNFTISSGHTMTTLGPLQIIFCKDTCTIAGTISTVGKGATGTINSGAVGYGGGAGGEGINSNVPGGSSYLNGMLVASDGSSPTTAIINQFISFFAFNPLSGGSGGGSGSIAKGGNGAGGLIIIAKQINFTGVVNAYGSAGAVPPNGASGGGGGAGVILGAKTWIANTGSINVAGGTGDSSGGAGWYRKITID